MDPNQPSTSKKPDTKEDKAAKYRRQVSIDASLHPDPDQSDKHPDHPGKPRMPRQVSIEQSKQSDHAQAHAHRRQSISDRRQSISDHRQSTSGRRQSSAIDPISSVHHLRKGSIASKGSKGSYSRRKSSIKNIVVTHHFDVEYDDIECTPLPVSAVTRCISRAKTISILVKFARLQMAACSVFSVHFSKLTLFYTLFLT
jgi:hypothetical protein